MANKRWAGAKCANYPTLPWTDDMEPGMWEQRQMGEICDSCTIKKQCALYALDGSNNNAGPRAAGGFYAGVWLPWPSTSDQTATNRRSARDALRRVVVVNRELTNA